MSPFASACLNSDILEVLPRATLHLPSDTRTFSRTHIVSLYLHSVIRKLRGPTPCLFVSAFRDSDILEDLPRATLRLPSELGLFPDLSSCLNTYCSRQSSPYVERPSIRENEAERDGKTEIKEVKFLAAGEVCTATFRPARDLKERMCWQLYVI